LAFHRLGPIDVGGTPALPAASAPALAKPQSGTGIELFNFFRGFCRQETLDGMEGAVNI